MRRCTMPLKILLLSGAALAACERSPERAELNVPEVKPAWGTGLDDANMVAADNAAAEAAAYPADPSADPDHGDAFVIPPPRSSPARRSSPTFAQPPDPPMPPPPPPRPRPRGR